MTRRFVLAMAVMSTALVLMGLPIAQLALTFLAPVPFEYRDLPAKVCSPSSSQERCAPLAEGDSFHPGDIVPFVVSRCVNDLFSTNSEFPYVVNRNVVNASTGLRVILPELATNVRAGGCTTSITMAHQLPETLTPGSYFLEGVATVYGRFRTVNSYFRTETFSVLKAMKETDG